MHIKSKALLLYLTFGLLEGLGSLVTLLRIPADQKNAWLLGMSPSRVVLLGGILLGLAIFLGAGLAAWGAQSWRTRVNLQLDALQANSRAHSRALSLATWGAFLILLRGRQRTHPHFTRTERDPPARNFRHGLCSRLHPPVAAAKTPKPVNAPGPAHPEHTIWIDELEYVRIYKLTGRE